MQPVYSPQRENVFIAEEPVRVKIIITDAERRKARVDAKVDALKSRVKAVRAVLTPKREDPEITRMKSVLLGRTTKIAATPMQGSLRDNFRSDDAVQAVAMPASWPLTLAVHIMHIILALTALPVGIMMATMAFARGEDFAMTARTMVMTGITLYALSTLNGMPFA